MERKPILGNEASEKWLPNLVTPELIDEVKKTYPKCQEASTGWLLYQRLEVFSRIDDNNNRLKTLVGILGPAIITSLNPKEQKAIQEDLGAKPSETKYEITDQTIGDLQYLWATFGLKRPEEKFAKLMNFET